jgi:FkbM family methyltransferase
MTTKLRNLSKKLALALVYKLPPFPQQINGQLVWVHPRARFSNSTKTFFKREAHARKWVAEYLKPGQVFFDVGAHHGWYSMWALPLVGKEGAVYSFEPSPANLSILEWHRRNNKYLQWVIVPNGVCDEDARERTLFLVDCGDSPMNSLTTGVPGTPLLEGRALGKLSIQTLTLDAFCWKVGARPDLVKIDVEGAELLVLHGASKILSESCPAIILAVHPYWLPCGQSTAQIVEYLEAYGYTIFDSKDAMVRSLRSGEYLCLNAKAKSPDRKISPNKAARN